MGNEGETELQPGEETRRFSGLREFQDALRGLLAQAVEQSWTELRLCDPDFADWPLGERATIDMLNAWARPGRKLIMLAGRYDELLRRHARFMPWRRTWSHIIECHVSGSADVRSTPSAFWSRRRMLHRFDLDGCAGLVTSEPVRCLRLKQELDDCLAVSTPGLPASTLGL